MSKFEKLIAVVAPAGVPDPSNVQAGIALVTQWGFNVVTGSNLGQRHRYLAGTSKERASDMVSALVDPTVDIVWLARGGFGCAHLLESLPADFAAPKTIVGFSDATSLFIALDGTPGLELVHGPTFHSLATVVDEESRADVRAVLAGRRRAPLPLRRLHGHNRDISGRLCGGNVTTLASMSGTPWSPQFADGIVLLEDVTEIGYRLDRSLTQLRLSGAFEGARAFVLGHFTRCPIPEGADYTLEDILVDALSVMGLPIYTGLSIGHESRNIAWKYGTVGSIQNSTISLD